MQAWLRPCLLRRMPVDPPQTSWRLQNPTREQLLDYLEGKIARCE